MKIIKKIIDTFFYDPYKVIKNKKNVSLSDSVVLLSSCRFRFPNNYNNSVTIGENTMVGCSFIFESDQGEINIGNSTFINETTQLISRSSICIGNNVTIAWGCTVYDHNSHSLDYVERQKDIDRQLIDYRNGNDFIYSKNWSAVKSKPIFISDNVWIGFNCIILAGVTIGEGAIVGAGSVVREDVEPWTIVAGNPAVLIKRLR